MIAFIRGVSRSSVAWAVVAVSVLYWLAVLVIPVGEVLIFVHAVAFVAAVAVSVAYLPAIIYAIRKDQAMIADYFIAGLVCMQLSTAAVRGWTTFYQILGRPLWMFQHPIFGFAIVLGIFGSIVLLTAPGSIDGSIPPRNWMKAGLVIAGGCALAVAVAWLSVVDPI